MSLTEDEPGKMPLIRCQYCCARIAATAKKCRHCGEWQANKSPGQKSQTKDVWEKLEVSGKLFGAILIPIVLALLANSVNMAIKTRDVDLEMVKLAVGILQSDPAEQNTALRKWAVLAINQHAHIPITDAAEEELLSRPLPTGDIVSLRRTLYRETHQVIARLIEQPEEIREDSADQARFWQLYRKDLIGVESREVADAMVAFGKELNSFTKSPSSSGRNATELKKLGEEVKTRLREELSRVDQPVKSGG